MRLCRVTFKQACDFVEAHHRHHKKPQGHIISIGCEDDGELIGVAMIGRPVSRHKQAAGYLEVIRLCVLPGKRNAASWLNTRAQRVIHALGCHAITYTLPSEGGVSLRASGWEFDGEAGGGEWTRPSRERGPAQHPTERKHRWIKQLEKKPGGAA